MKRAAIIFSLLIFSFNISIAQSIDTVLTKVDIDSIPYKIRLTGFNAHQVITAIPVTNLTGLADTQDIKVYFKCLSSSLTLFRYDTSIDLTNAVYPFSVRITTIIDSGRNDTSAGIYCNPPLPIYVDTFFIPAAKITGLKSVAVLEQKINVYPNPTDNWLYFNANPEIRIESIELYSLEGKKLARVENKNAVNVQHLPRGIYIARIRTNKGLATEKIYKE